MEWICYHVERIELEGSPFYAQKKQSMIHEKTSGSWKHQSTKNGSQELVLALNTEEYETNVSNTSQNKSDPTPLVIQESQKTLGEAHEHHEMTIQQVLSEGSESSTSASQTHQYSPNSPTRQHPPNSSTQQHSLSNFESPESNRNYETRTTRPTPTIDLTKSNVPIRLVGRKAIPSVTGTLLHNLEQRLETCTSPAEEREIKGKLRAIRDEGYIIPPCGIRMDGEGNPIGNMYTTKNPTYDDIVLADNTRVVGAGYDFAIPERSTGLLRLYAIISPSGMHEVRDFVLRQWKELDQLCYGKPRQSRKQARDKYEAHHIVQLEIAKIPIRIITNGRIEIFGALQAPLLSIDSFDEIYRRKIQYVTPRARSHYWVAKTTPKINQDIGTIVHTFAKVLHTVFRNMGEETDY